MSLRKTKKPKISQASASFSTSVVSRPSRQGRQSTLHCEANKKVVKKTQVRISERNLIEGTAEKSFPFFCFVFVG